MSSDLYSRFPVVPQQMYGGMAGNRQRKGITSVPQGAIIDPRSIFVTNPTNIFVEKIYPRGEISLFLERQLFRILKFLLMRSNL